MVWRMEKKTRIFELVLVPVRVRACLADKNGVGGGVGMGG